MAGLVIGAVNSSGPAFSYTATCSGTTTATCTGNRWVASVTGLTTAAGIWLTAAIGVAAGLGKEMTAVLSTLLALGVLAMEPLLRRLVPPHRRHHS